MRPKDEIISNKRLNVQLISTDGGSGIIGMPLWRGSVIWSTGAGWDHVSVMPQRKGVMPSWDDMCKIKDIFFEPDEVAIQIHPAQSEYVNNVPNCLHLWRCSYKDMVLPPACLVGVKKGQTAADLMQEIEQAYAMAGENY